MFAADGTILHRLMKSSLIAILEKLPLDEVPTLDQTDEILRVQKPQLIHKVQWQLTLQNQTQQLQNLKSH